MLIISLVASGFSSFLALGIGKYVGFAVGGGAGLFFGGADPVGTVFGFSLLNCAIYAFASCSLLNKPDSSAALINAEEFSIRSPLL